MSTGLNTPVYDIYWSKEYVQAAQEIMVHKMDEVYSELFLNELTFSSKSSNSISRKEMLKNICGNTFRGPTCPWIFNPKILRIKFKQIFENFIRTEE